MTTPFKDFSVASRLLILGVAYLLLIGLLIQFSIQARNQPYTSNPQVQLLAAGIGLVAFIVMAWLPFHRLRKAALVAYGVTLLLLILVSQYGPIVFGARRWLLIGGFQLQPSELLKPLLAFVDAIVLVEVLKKIGIRQVALYVLVLVVPVALLLQQPDLSTSLMLILIWFVQLMVSPLKGQVVGWLLGVMALTAVLALPLLNSYQHGRIQNFFQARNDDSITSYNVVQARVAMGSGGLTGRGLTGGSQSQLRFLPAQQTDFVFAVIAEKLGFIGAVSVVLAEAIVGLSAWRIVSKARSTYTVIVGVGMVTVLSAQALVNIAMNVGLAPVAGLPLPFVSYGGTSLVISLAMVGWIVGLDRANKSANRRRQLFTYPSTSVNLDQS